MHVLIVEDDATTRTLLERTLSGDGWRTSSANDGLEALKLADRRDPDVILLDYQLPGIDGLEVLDRLVARGVEAPVVMLTGHGSEVIAYQALTKGAVDYLTKQQATYDQLKDLLAKAVDDWNGVDRLGSAPRSVARGPASRRPLPSGLEQFLAVTPLEGLVVCDRRGRTVVERVTTDLDTELIVARAATLAHQSQSLAEAAGDEEAGQYTLIRGSSHVLAVASATGGLTLLAVIPAATPARECISLIQRAARIVSDTLGAGTDTEAVQPAANASG